MPKYAMKTFPYLGFEFPSIMLEPIGEKYLNILACYGCARVPEVFSKLPTEACQFSSVLVLYELHPT